MEPWARSSGRSPTIPGSPRHFGSSPPGLASAWTDSSPDQEASSLKPVRRFLPPSWKNAFRGWWRRPQAETSLPTYTPKDFRSSPPVSPVLERPKRMVSEGLESLSKDTKQGSVSSGDDDEKVPLASSTDQQSGKAVPTPRSQGGRSTPPPGYQGKLEAYESKYAYMKSWPGLLRLMGALELILGGMAFACTAAYLQKDYQWSQLYGGGQWPYGGAVGAGYSYYGPMTAFVLAVASLAWLVTVILLGLGVTMYYRTILLRAHWWPLTEFGLNLFLSLLYLAASLAYVHDINRGGLCYSLLAANPLVAAICRVGGGQVAALTFLFLNTLLYLAGALVCLRMWSHEGGRRGPPVQPKLVLLREAPKPAASLGATPRPPGTSIRRVEFSEKSEDPERLNYAIPTGYNPKPHIVPDYIMKYPAVRSTEEREKYKAVFSDQYGEYKELHREIQAALQKFRLLDEAMAKLPRRYQSQKEQRRASALRKEYERKKKDPAFLEKQERCEYLKRKLAHLKGQIQAYDRENGEGGSSVYF
ncbi:occludin/ELL domain-containing protein 1 [Pogona vitticeps]